MQQLCTDSDNELTSRYSAHPCTIFYFNKDYRLGSFFVINKWYLVPYVYGVLCIESSSGRSSDRGRSVFGTAVHFSFYYFTHTVLWLGSRLRQLQTYLTLQTSLDSTL